VAELPREQYDRGRRDGQRGAIPLSPWSKPASAWSQLERNAYLTGLRYGRTERKERPSKKEKGRP